MNRSNLWDTLKGKKTALFFGLALVTGLANMAGFTDWQPTADQAEFMVLFFGFAGLFFRWLTRYTYK